jgi:hypothetical protein
LFFLFMFRHLLLLVLFLVFLAALVSHDFSFGARLILNLITANAVERGCCASTERSQVPHTLEGPVVTY